MATQSTNYDFILPEGSDKVNLLTQNNPNWENADSIIKAISDKAVHTATELFTQTVHAITRQTPDAAMFRFTAVSNYAAGDTFTVDGVQVTALLTTGESLGSGAYIIGSEVLCCLKGTLLTVYVNSGTVTTAQDSEKLGGELPAYYAKQTDLTQTNEVAKAAGTLAGQNQQAISAINQILSAINTVVDGVPRKIGTRNGIDEYEITFSAKNTLVNGATVLGNIGANKTITFSNANVKFINGETVYNYGSFDPQFNNRIAYIPSTGNLMLYVSSYDISAYTVTFRYTD